jgi:hypothetical protein
MAAAFFGPRNESASLGRIPPAEVKYWLLKYWYYGYKGAVFILCIFLHGYTLRYKLE